MDEDRLKINVGDIVFISFPAYKFVYKSSGELKIDICQNGLLGGQAENYVVCKYLGDAMFEEMLTGYKMRLFHSNSYSPNKKYSQIHLGDSDGESFKEYGEIKTDYDSTLDYYDSEPSEYTLENYYNDLEVNKEVIKKTPIVITDDFDVTSIDDPFARKDYFEMTDEQRIEWLNRVKKECEESAVDVIQKIDEVLGNKQFYVPKEDIVNAYFDNQIYDFQHGIRK